MKPKISIREILRVVRAIDSGPLPAAQLLRRVRLHKSSLYRYMADCERELGMRITCEDRLYRIDDWGVLDPRRVRSARLRR